ncbi:hypothetical protein [Paraburkholderia fynbosensis]|uniref:Uncharacterized protein n=1 Tax=Paraburkholderia fynbosensis TaxID=1200993 RepID=A0A6J5G9Q6_9BURK|nr:hypothetical protein [Paraburkholderia fynbosensis]CAB3792524.1 hypothetical protein LMG27177_03271 [Paraburkholderia fynbosensis]
MSVESKPAPALLRKRLTSALIITSLSALLGGCGNDDDAARTNTLGATNSTADDSNSSPSAFAALPGNSSSATPAPPSLTIQTPALPASDAGATLSAVAPAPLATPVIHTVD